MVIGTNIHKKMGGIFKFHGVDLNNTLFERLIIHIAFLYRWGCKILSLIRRTQSS